MTAFAGGLLHPLLAPTHVMAVLALALLIGQQGWAYRIAVAYAAAVIVGLALIAAAHVPTRVEEGLFGLAAIAGLIVAQARPLPPMAGVVFAAALGLAIGLDSPPETISLRDANLALFGTAIGAPVVLLALVWMASRPTRAWQRIGMRIAGSWIAASAILVLALRLVR